MYHNHAAPDTIFSIIPYATTKIHRCISCPILTDFLENRVIEKVDISNNFGQRKILATVTAANSSKDTIQGTILEALREHGKFVKAAHFYVPVYKTNAPTTAQKNSISSALNSIRTSGNIERFKKDNNNNLTFWGLREWFRDDMTPDKRYLDEYERGLDL